LHGPKRAEKKKVLLANLGVEWFCNRGNFIMSILEKNQSGVSAKMEKATDRPWMKHFGSLRNFHDERQEIELRMKDEFGQVDTVGWRTSRIFTRKRRARENESHFG
jgi:hypothetical protein